MKPNKYSHTYEFHKFVTKVDQESECWDLYLSSICKNFLKVLFNINDEKKISVFS